VHPVTPPHDRVAGSADVAKDTEHVHTSPLVAQVSSSNGSDGSGSGDDDDGTTPVFNEDGAYVVRKGDVYNNRYKVMDNKILGKGTFGRVVWVLDMKTNKDYALKVVKNKHVYTEEAKKEVKMLEMLTRCAGDADSLKRYNIVQLIDRFVHDSGNHCLVFELLGPTLLNTLQSCGMSWERVSVIGKQLLETLLFLRRPDVNIMHCDLKPENVLVLPYQHDKVKLADFGSSVHPWSKIFSYVQTRMYRAPEVMLGLPYSHSMDMWSLGCLLVEMITGRPLFNGRNEKEQLMNIVKMRGMPPSHMLAVCNSPTSRILFSRTSQGGTWMMCGNRDIDPIKLDDLLPLKNHSIYALEQRRMFIEIVDLMLTLDPNERITPKRALEMPFFNQLQEASLI